MTRTALLATLAFTAGCSAWFVVSWAVMDSSVVDALGEMFGGMMVLLLLLSIMGSLVRGDVGPSGSVPQPGAGGRGPVTAVPEGPPPPRLP